MITGLNGLRAIAFLAVFFFHARYFDGGWLGVQFFFVLSGFLITGILLDMKALLSKKQYFIKFFGRRFLRIFPLYYFYLIAMGLLATWLISVNYRPGWLELFTSQVKYAALYLYNFHAATIYHEYNHFLTHFWSLAVEEQFYIFWPILILLTPEKWYKKLFVSLIILGPFFRLGLLFIHNYGGIRMFVESPGEAIYYLPLTYIDAFAMGAYISRYSISHAKKQFFLLLVSIPILGYVAQYITTGDMGTVSSFGYPLHMPNAYQFIWGYSILSYFFAVTIYAVAKHGLFARILEWEPLNYLGRISYGLYVYHLPLLWFAFNMEDFITIRQEAVQPLGTVIAFLATLLLASASYSIMEKPLLSLKERLFPLGTSQERLRLRWIMNVSGQSWEVKTQRPKIQGSYIFSWEDIKSCPLVKQVSKSIYSDPLTEPRAPRNK